MQQTGIKTSTCIDDLIYRCECQAHTPQSNCEADTIYLADHAVSVPSEFLQQIHDHQRYSAAGWAATVVAREHKLCNFDPENMRAWQRMEELDPEASIVNSGFRSGVTSSVMAAFNTKSSCRVFL